MLREFFREGSRRSVAWAWSGLLLILGHAIFRAWIKYKLNAWYGEFYDLGGSAVEVSSGDTDGLAEGRREVSRLLLLFGAICAPNVIIHPIFKLLTNRWVLSWRLKLIKSYIRRWRLDDKKIENGAQRVHEDTQRFARGIQTTCVVFLDAILTLAVFAPLLLQLGSDVKPSDLPDAWLFVCCASIAVGGVVVSTITGWSLVQLEVENQKVEADLRKKLVMLEEDPASVCGRQEERVPRACPPDTAIDPDVCIPDVVDVELVGQAVSTVTRGKASWKQIPPVPQFRRVLADLKTNYARLYNRFAIFSLWLESYEQTVAIVPYFLTAPLLFCEDTERRITLGKVTQLSNAFAQVFASLNILSDNWVDVTDWLSVLRRLREWESHIDTTPQSVSHTLIAPGTTSSTEMQPPSHEVLPTTRC
jgi:peptide/bleomycin uptake transporter|tara:strand:+ start:10004 stop:11257 length:1254 start_codon:yes stop_codon:yes gene_type:complete